MKKILYFLLVLLLFASCNSNTSSFNNEYECYELHELVKWDDTKNKAVYDQKYVSLDGVTITAIIDNMITVGDFDGDSVVGYSNVASLDVVFDHEVNFGWKDIVDIKGQVTSISGRIVLEGHDIYYDNDEETSKGAGKVITYSIYGRSGFENLDYHCSNGYYIKSTFEIASLFDFDNDNYVLSLVYPGEPYREPYLINCYIPNTISLEQKNILVNIFDNYQIGSHIEFRAQFYYDNKPSLRLPSHLFNEELYKEIDCHITNSWDDCELWINDYYNIDYPDFNNNDANVYYFDDASYYDTRNIIAIYIYGDDINKIFDNYYINCLKNGWTLSNSNDQQYTFIYQINKKTVASIGVSKFEYHIRLLINGTSSSETIYEYDSFNELKNHLSNSVKESCSFLDDSFEISIINEFTAEKYILDLSSLKINEDKGVYLFNLTFNYDNETLLNDDYDSLILSLKQNFLELNHSSLNKYGYFNSEQHEFISLYKENNNLIINYYIFNPNSSFYPNYRG